MASARETSGGSAANSMAGVAALGRRAAFIGQIANDQLGDIFAHDMRALGVQFDTPPLTNGPPTGRCLILVTPDAQRTMNTSPGRAMSWDRKCSTRPDPVGQHYLSRRLFVGPIAAAAAMLRAATSPMRPGRKVAFTLSESLCIAGRREGVMGMIDEGRVDILFANEDEVGS